ncbi:uroporphyrinogen-III synthase [Buchnera aphidicola (Diuraphis noxia)]|uniref:Uroporphyrinogen-III synthase n=1 Tax=Buchnera aphidicola subsp. Diuraphis noxia TaxID=118101 RepID=A0A1B2H9B5_BUCDN|nr:uroporphyrinogen-III synthase [Buchnera aphidicola]ANZ22765.1 uroporphyrinogen-III synthase [Buchnera aphidicola (Diuraphis noxia)]
MFFPQEKENSENLLKLLYRNLLKNDKIVLLQGENGRKLIQRQLKKKFNISLVECYKRVVKNIDMQIEEKKWRSYKINTLVITSSEILYHVKNVVSSLDRTDWLLKCKIFVISIRLLKIAKYLGWNDVIVASCASNNCLIKRIEEIKYIH